VAKGALLLGVGAGFARFSGEPIPAYFAMLMAAFVACTFFAVRWAKRERRDHEVLIDLALVSLITGVAGSRIAHVLFDGYLMDYVHLCTDPAQVAWQITREQCGSEWVQGAWDEAASVCRPTEGDCFAWAKFWQGGLTWYGGMVLGVGYAMHFLKKERFPRIKVLDMGGMILPLGLFFGRLGCWFGGCCFGQPTDAWFGVSFPPWSPASEAQWRADLLPHPSHESLAVIPTQLLEAGGSLLIALAIIGWLEPRKRFEGQVFCVSMIAYAVLRFVLEMFRADERGAAGGLSTSQWVGVAIVAAAAVAWPILQRRSRAIFEAARGVSPAAAPTAR
jgi:phosphatidylglycerol---prolipoprotein diacylglyceryl transferase